MKKYAGLVAAFACLGAAAVAVSLAGAPSDLRQASSEEGFRDVIPAADEIRNLALAYDGRISALEGRVGETRDAVRAIQAALGELISIVEAVPGDGTPPGPTQPPPAREPDRLLVIDLDPSEGEATPLRVPAGGFAEGTLLTGVFAPISGEPMPVLIRLDAVMTGPMATRVPLRGAFLIGKAVGDANASRAIVQLVTLSTESSEIAVNAYVVDADGVQGLAGRYVWNAGQLAGLSAAAGLATGASQALAQSQATSTVGPFGTTAAVTGDPYRFAAASGGATALTSVSRLIEERMREFTPSVYVDNRDRRVTVVFLQGAAMPAGSRRPEPDERSRRVGDGLGGFDR
jgi:hypothetical protein